MMSSTKPEIHRHIALSSEEDRAIAANNMYRKCCLDAWCLRYASGQTQTDTQTCSLQYSATLLAAN